MLFSWEEKSRSNNSSRIQLNFYHSYRSIQPASHFLCAYLVSGCSGGRLSKVFQTSLPHQQRFPDPPGGILRHSEARWHMPSLQHVLGLPRGAPHGWLCPGKASKGKHPGGSWSDARTTSTGSVFFFGAEWPAASLQAPLWMSEFIDPISEPSHPTEKLQPLEFAISFFRSVTKSVVHIWGLERGSTGEFESFTFLAKLPQGLLEDTDRRGRQIYVIC